MKQILFLLLLLGCQSESIEPEKIGCAIGVRDSRIQLIRCCTKSQFLAGSNEVAGGISYFTNYKNPQWVQVKSCNECDKYR